MTAPTATALSSPDFYLLASSASSTGNGTAITAITDSSATPKTVTPSTGANVPTFIDAAHSDTPTPVPLMRFTTGNTTGNGAAGYFNVPSNSGSNALLGGINDNVSPRTFIYAVRRRNGGASFQVLSTTNTGGVGPCFNLLVTGGSTDTFERYNVAMGSVPLNAWHIITFTQVAATAGNMVETVYVDGVQVYTGTNPVPAAQTPTNPLFIGTDPNNTFGFNGDMAAMLVYNRALTNSDRQTAEIALSDYTGITVANRPANSPVVIGTLSAVPGSRTPTTLSPIATAATGGNGTLTYQWYRSTVSRGASAPAPADKVGGAFTTPAGLTLSDTGLTAKTAYFYTLSVTDGTTTVYYPELALRTAGNQRVDVLTIGNSTDSPQRFGNYTPSAYMAEQWMTDNPNLYVVVNNQAISGAIARSVLNMLADDFSGWTRGSGSVAVMMMKWGENDCRVTPNQGPIPATTDNTFPSPYDQSFRTTVQNMIAVAQVNNVPVVIHDGWENSQDTANPLLMPQYWAVNAVLAAPPGSITGNKPTSGGGTGGVWQGDTSSHNFLTEQGGKYNCGDTLHENAPVAYPTGGSSAVGQGTQVLGQRYAVALESVFSPAVLSLSAGAISGSTVPVYANSPANSLNWSVASAGGAGAASVSAAGVVTLPNGFTAGQSVTVTAVSKLDGTKSANVTITGTAVVVPPITTTPSSPAATIGGSAVQITLGGGSGGYALGATSGAGSWNLSGATLTYTPPAAGNAGSATAVVTSGGLSQTAVVNLLSPTVSGSAVQVQILPASTILSGGMTQAFTATVTNDPQNRGVIWSAAHADGGTGSAGSLASGGATTITYTAPSATGATQHILLTATSIADPTQSASVMLTILSSQFVLNASGINATGDGWDMTLGNLVPTQMLPGELVRLYVTGVQFVNRDGTPHLPAVPLTYRMALTTGAAPAESEWFPAVSATDSSGALTILSPADLDTNTLSPGTYRVAVEAAEANGQRIRKFVNGTVTRF